MFKPLQTCSNLFKPLPPNQTLPDLFKPLLSCTKISQPLVSCSNLSQPNATSPYPTEHTKPHQISLYPTFPNLSISQPTFPYLTQTQPPASSSPNLIYHNLSQYHLTLLSLKALALFHKISPNSDRDRGKLMHWRHFTRGRNIVILTHSSGLRKPTFQSVWLELSLPASDMPARVKTVWLFHSTVNIYDTVWLLSK